MKIQANGTGNGLLRRSLRKKIPTVGAKHLGKNHGTVTSIFFQMLRPYIALAGTHRLRQGKSPIP